ncbi:ATPase/histidine kinase/DNA gyrase B/HSP90 domain protein [Clostridiales bacterium oral taxon 876 str. F0540]|nr:ATPase/histidine kinase/DNA gyrase B/HSP90 domain protein [Clostridiales bacterium oral taxon 876 str. F0540]
MRKNIFTRKISVKLLLSVVVCFFLSAICGGLFSRYVSYDYILKAKELSPTVYNIITVWIFSVVILVFIITFLLLINKEVKYIKYIAKEVKTIANEQFGSTLKVQGNDELAELCKSINTMSLELKNKFEHEREIENTKAELITNVSHDLRTPLTAIIGYLDILKSERYKNREEEKEYITSTYNLSIKLKRLIDELFEYTKLSSGGIKLEVEEVNLSTILVQMLGEYTPMLEAKGLRIVTDIDEEIPAKIDIEKIVRVFDNVLSNAEKYSVKPSDIIIRAENKEGIAHILISNKSEHIEQDKLNKMFDKFYRVDVSRSSNIEGSGLGLAISKKIIELHGGQIWAECDGDVIKIYINLNTNDPI